MQNLDVPANWEDAEDARLESRQAVASLIHSPRARERFMADDASLSSAHSRQTSAYGGHPPKEPVSLPEHRFQYHHSFPTGLHEKRTHFAPSRRSPPLVAVHSNSVNHNGCISSSVPWSFDPPPPPRSENHVSLKRATHVPIPSWVPQPQSSTASTQGSASASVKVESQDSQRLGSQVSTPRGSPSKMDKLGELLNGLITSIDAAEVQRQAAAVKHQAAEAKRHEHQTNLTQNLTTVLERLTEQLAKFEPPVPRTSP